MIRYKVEYAISGTVEDILNFLKRDNHRIPSETVFSKEENGEDFYINYYCHQKSNNISINTIIYSTQTGKIAPRCYYDDPRGEGNEVIRFEIIRVSDSRSLIIGYYAADNLSVEAIFWLSMTRLAKAFDAKWDKEVQKYYQETKSEITKSTGMEWGWTNWKIDKSTGLRMRSFGLIPVSHQKKKIQKTSKEKKKIKQPSHEVKIEIKGSVNNSNITVGNKNTSTSKRKTYKHK